MCLWGSSTVYVRGRWPCRPVRFEWRRCACCGTDIVCAIESAPRTMGEKDALPVAVFCSCSAGPGGPGSTLRDVHALQHGEMKWGKGCVKDI